MRFDLWLAYTIALTVVVAIPGPTNVMVMAYGFRHGTKPALFTAFGVVPGTVVAMILSFVGLGAILAVSSRLFLVMKWAGALYLIYLGVSLWRSTPSVDDSPHAEGVSYGRICLHAFTVSLLNPKGIIFYTAFMPQFISPEDPMLRQMLILALTLVAIAIPTNIAYALLSGKLRSFIKRRKTLRAMNRTGGLLLVGAGVFTALLRRSS
jgi:threonine/homoserine/homoserine lactone efflux protein